MPGLIGNLLNSTAQPSLARSVRFGAARHALLTANVANSATPGYVQKDLSRDAFNASLGKTIDTRRRTGHWDDVSDKLELSDEVGGILYHDGNNRSMEELMAETAKNALHHNTMVELMRREFDQLESAIRERVA